MQLGIFEKWTFWESIETLKTHIATFWRQIASATQIDMKWSAQKDIGEIKLYFHWWTPLLFSAGLSEVLGDAVLQEGKWIGELLKIGVSRIFCNISLLKKNIRNISTSSPQMTAAENWISCDIFVSKNILKFLKVILQYLINWKKYY